MLSYLSDYSDLLWRNQDKYFRKVRIKSKMSWILNSKSIFKQWHWLIVLLRNNCLNNCHAISQDFFQYSEYVKENRGQGNLKKTPQCLLFFILIASHLWGLNFIYWCELVRFREFLSSWNWDMAHDMTCKKTHFKKIMVILPFSFWGINFSFYYFAFEEKGQNHLVTKLDYRWGASMEIGEC